MARSSTLRPARWVVVVCGVLISALAWATPDFSGRYALDPAASESLEPLLQAQGVSWALRKAAAAARPTLEIAQTAETISITSHSPKGQTTEVFTPDGQPHATASLDGPPATWTSTWRGEVLVSTRPVAVGPDKVPGTLTLERRKVGAELHQTLVLALEGGATHRVLRVFTPTGG